MKRFSPKPIILTIGAALAIAIAFRGSGKAQTINGGPTSARYAFQAVGIRAGEEVRVSVTNLSSIPPGPCRIRLVNSDGRSVADSGEIRIANDATVHFTIDFSNLDIPTELSGRKQFRVVVVLALDPTIQFPPGPCRPGVELINVRTGHTFGILVSPDPNLTF